MAGIETAEFQYTYPLMWPHPVEVSADFKVGYARGTVIDMINCLTAVLDSPSLTLSDELPKWDDREGWDRRADVEAIRYRLTFSRAGLWRTLNVLDPRGNDRDGLKWESTQ